MNQREIKLREIANAAVHQLGALAAGAAGEVALLHQADAMATRGCFQGDPRAGDAATDHQYIHALGGHAPQRFLAFSIRKSHRV